MISVLHILWSAHFGGIEKLVLDLATAQARSSQFQVGVLFGQKEGEFIERFHEAGLSCYSAHLNGGYYVRLWKYIHAIHLFKEYDILHFHTFTPFLGLCAVVSRKRIVYTLHGVPGRRKTRLRDFIKTPLLRCFFSYYVHYVSFNSKFTKHVAEKVYRVRSSRSSVIYNGIALRRTRFHVSDIEQPILSRVHRKFVVGTTAHFRAFKRTDRLIQAFADFQKNKGTILLLVGDGPVTDELQRLVNQLGLTDKTIFAGFRHNVWEFHGLMDVCVFPSENEPFGLVAVEALSLGKPTIVFGDGGGIVEVVGSFSQDDVVWDVPQLVDRLQFYYDHKDQRGECIQQRIEYSKNFDIKKMRDKFHVIYKEALPFKA